MLPRLRASFEGMHTRSSLQIAEISNQVYWRDPFPALANVTELTEYYILDVEPLGPTRGKYVLADVEVMRTSDNQQFTIRTHLGGILHPGDDARGYNLVGSNFNNEGFEALADSKIPPVLLVKKHYQRRKKNKTRHWKLQHIGREEGDMLPRKQDQDRAERDYELFLREIEEDTELRQTLQLFKSTVKTAPKTTKMDGVEMEMDGDAEEATEDADEMDEDDEDESDDENGLPQISMDELLDEFEAKMNVADDAAAEAAVLEE